MSNRISEAASPPSSEAAASNRLGFWSALIITTIGVVYVGVLAVLAAGGGFVMPPSQPVQLFGAVVTLAMAPLLVVLMVCIHQSAPTRQKPWSLSALAFTILFAAMVSINRFVQLAVVRQGLAGGRAADLRLFLPYDIGSVMFALEILGWGFFLSLAALCAAPVFAGKGVERWLRVLFLAYGILGLTSTCGHIFASPVTAVGFIAWGPVLDVIAALLCVWFWRRARGK